MPHKATTKIRQQKTRETNNKHAISEKTRKKEPNPEIMMTKAVKKPMEKTLRSLVNLF